MLLRARFMNLVLGLVCSALLIGQEKSDTAASMTVEFPVILQQGVSAGKTPVGTKVQASLTMATLLNGKVIPKNAIFFGEVVESAAKTATEPSRLSIRMESVSWKDGTAPVKVYISSSYYPTLMETGQQLQYGPEQPAKRTWNGAGQYPDPNSPVYKPFPGPDDKDKSAPNTPNSVTAKQRALMKNVEVQSTGDGGLELTSKKSNIKLDRFTTYLLISSTPAK